MIEELRIQGLGVISEAVLPLGPGLTVLTGETGAGKTMVVTALGLLLGNRPDASLVRRGAAAATVDATVLVDPAGAVATMVAEAGGTLDGDVLLLSRTVPATGRARAFAGGRPVPAAVLADLAADLVTVHGQSDQLLLRSPARQRGVVDRYAATMAGAEGELLERYRAAQRLWREAVAELDAFDTGAAARAAERDQLITGLAAIDAVSPEPGEDQRLDEEWARLAHVEELRQAADIARETIGGDDGAVSLLGRSRAALDGVRGHDPQAEALAARVAELLYLASDLATDASAYATGLDADPERLAEVESRRRDVTRLVRVHGDVDAALAWAQRARDRLAELSEDGRRDVLAGAVQALRGTVGEVGAQLSASRRQAAEALSAAVTTELASLALPRARLVVAVSSGTQPGPDGFDDVEMRLAAHSAADPQPIARAASGGELSRVMLGVEVVVGAVGTASTFVFDEVDAGVGGAAALGIGRRLARLAADCQVIVVTHLAQVAAYGDRHLTVQKADDGSDTVSTVLSVTGEDRVREIARMLAGDATSQTATAHAAELLATAAQQRDGERHLDQGSASGARAPTS